MSYSGLKDLFSNILLVGLSTLQSMRTFLGTVQKLEHFVNRVIQGLGLKN